MGEEHLYDKERLKYQNGRKEDRGKVGCYNNNRELGRYLQKGQSGRRKERGKLDTNKRKLQHYYSKFD